MSANSQTENDRLEIEQLRKILDYQSQIALTNYDSLQKLLVLIHEQKTIVQIQSNAITALVNTVEQLLEQLERYNGDKRGNS